MLTASQYYPKALPFLFLTEMWERFGFYVVEGLLILYLTKGFGFSDDKSYTILGIFSALAYITPMLGGLIADRLLGFKSAIVWGGAFLSVGYAYLAMGTGELEFYFALAIIVVGNGLFKPNISSLLGALYPAGDTARDTGFTIFYVGINIGVLLAGISSGYIKNHFGWQAGFGLASIGLVLGLIIFAIGHITGRVTYNPTALFSKAFLKRPFIFLYCILAVPLLVVLMKNNFLAKWLLPMVGALLLIFMFYIAVRHQGKARARLLTLNVLIISSIIFWTLFLQIFFSANLFIERLVDKQIFGVSLPTTVFYTFEPIFVIILGPLFAWSWQSLDLEGRNPPAFLKFVVAIFFVAVAFFILSLSTHFSHTNHLVAPFWIVAAYFFLTVGELLVSPIGLSAVASLSPPPLMGTMMGIWFVALGFGAEFAGVLAKLSSVPQSAIGGLTQLSVYGHAFLLYACLAVGIGLLLFFVQILFRKYLT